MDFFRKALRIWPWLAAVASGLLYAVCFPPFDQGWLCWFALTPLLAAIWFSGGKSKRRWLRHLSLGYVAGLAFFGTVFSWLTTVTVPGWFLLPFYMGIYIAIWAWFCGILRPKELGEEAAEPAPAVEAERKFVWPPPRPNERPDARPLWLNSFHNLRLALVLAAFWVTLEWLRGLVFSGWGWNSLGVALHSYISLIQIAEYTGVAGLSFLVAFANVIAITSVRRFMLEATFRPIRPHYDLTFTMALVVGLLGFGIRALQMRGPVQDLQVALVQANVPREEKFSAEFAQKTFDQFTRLSEYALQQTPRPTLIVWPESSMPGPVLSDAASYHFVMDFAANANVDLLLGSIDEDETRVYNAALLVSQAGKTVQLYRKIHLVPFGEYIPGRHIIPLLARIVGDQVPSDFDFGTKHTVFRLTNSNVLAAPLICFEDTIGDLTRQFVLGGANLLVNVTNDGWFLRSAASQQHLANAVFRCIETRRPMVRAANTGVTCFINEFGIVTSTLTKNGDQFVDGVLSGRVAVPMDSIATFYVQHGELFEHCCVVVAGLALLLAHYRMLRPPRPPPPFRPASTASTPPA